MGLLQKWDASKNSPKICKSALAPFVATAFVWSSCALAVLAEPKLKTQEIFVTAPPPNPMWISIFSALNYASAIAGVAIIVFGGMWLFRNHGMLDEEIADEQPADSVKPKASDAEPVASGESKSE